MRAKNFTTLTRPQLCNFIQLFVRELTLIYAAEWSDKHDISSVHDSADSFRLDLGPLAESGRVKPQMERMTTSVAQTKKRNPRDSGGLLAASGRGVQFTAYNLQGVSVYVLRQIPVYSLLRNSRSVTLAEMIIELASSNLRNRVLNLQGPCHLFVTRIIETTSTSKVPAPT